MGSAEFSRAVRERLLPLPTVVDDDYRQVLLLGTTGAGKTTVVRQLLGTDPVADRFPSTSTAKTTVADSEIIMADGPYRAVVTFFPRREVLNHIHECGYRAALSILHGDDANSIRGNLLDHEQQRFRFSYILGRATEPSELDSELTEFDDEFDTYDEFGEPEFGDASDSTDTFDAGPGRLPSIDLDATNAVISSAITGLRHLVDEHATTINNDLGATHDDAQTVAELIEDELEHTLRSDRRFDAIMESLLAEMEQRFDALSLGSIERDDNGWPQNWTWESDDRSAFLRAVNRFSSNYAPLFGHLLTPLVDGIRVEGPFRPTWWSEGDIPRLVLIDGEGLGHTPKSATSLSRAVAERINDVDAVLLVDNAAQPMQAAPAAAVRSILTSGNTDKLIFCFTHFDEVIGDNLSSPKERADHVLGSVNNLLATIGDDFGPRAERALNRRLDDNRVFLGGIDKPLSFRNANGKQSIKHFRRLAELLDQVIRRPELGPSRPVYEKATLERAIAAGIHAFHGRWDALFGLATDREVKKENWTRIKALNRRFAEGSADEYRELRPVADLREFIKEEIYKQLETPADWVGRRPDDPIILTGVIDEFSNGIASRLSEPISERLSDLAQSSWQESLEFHGVGSTKVRAEHIADEIFRHYVHESRNTPNAFLVDVVAGVDEAAKEVQITIR